MQETHYDEHDVLHTGHDGNPYTEAEYREDLHMCETWPDDTPHDTGLEVLNAALDKLRAGLEPISARMLDLEADAGRAGLSPAELPERRALAAALDVLTAAGRNH